MHLCLMNFFITILMILLCTRLQIVVCVVEQMITQILCRIKFQNVCCDPVIFTLIYLYANVYIFCLLHLNYTEKSY